MAATLRALRALLLLAGLYVMGTALVTAVLATDWLVLSAASVQRSPMLVMSLLFFSGALVVPALWGMFAFLLPGLRGRAPAGHPVTAEEQPELWEEIHQAARLARTRVPHQVIITGEVNAAVAERTHLLGLVPGRRRMYLGAPLLAGLTVPRLRSVLAHEFGHYSQQDTRLAGLTLRGREAVLRTVAAFQSDHLGAHAFRAQAFVGTMYARYARLFLRVSQSVARRQELAADEAAARHAGRDTTAAALREIPLLTAAYDHYLAEYAWVGAPASALPPAGEFYGGFPRLLAARGPAWPAELVADRPVERVSPYDSHPPIAERLARIGALPDDGLRDDPAAPPALSLLRDPRAVLVALEACTLTGEAAAMRRLEWPELVAAAAVTEARRAAEPVQRAVNRAVRTAPAGGPAAGPSGGPAAAATGAAGRPAGGSAPAGTARPAGAAGAAGLPGLHDVLDAIDAGLLWMAVADRIPKPQQASLLTGAAARNFVRPVVADGLAGLVLLHLTGESTAGGEERFWSGPVALPLPEGYEDRLGPAIDSAVADVPDTAAVRGLLAEAAEAAAAGESAEEARATR